MSNKMHCVCQEQELSNTNFPFSAVYNVLILKAPIKVIKPSRNSTDEHVKEKGLKDMISLLHNLLVIFTRRLKTISQYRVLIPQGMSVYRWISKTGNLINRPKVCKPETLQRQTFPMQTV